MPRRAPSVAATDAGVLRHVLVAGGTVADWEALGEARWHERVEQLGKVVAAAGGRWLTLRPFEAGPGAGDDTAGAGAAEPWDRDVDGCLVRVDPEPDGRARLIRAVDALGTSFSEEELSAAIDQPAECGPDLVLVLGDARRLPSSLVWDLAYGELVFTPVAWPDLHPAHLEAAVTEYARRDRRFGGISS